MDDESRHQLQWNDGVAIGDHVCFSIRPEKVIINEQSRPENALKGMVQEIIYIGETTRYKVIVGKDKIINVREMNTGDSSPFKKGEKVKLSWKMKNLRRLEN